LTKRSDEAREQAPSIPLDNRKEHTMKTAPQSSDGDKAPQSGNAAHTTKNPRSLQESAAPLPHETDQNAESQHEEAPRHVGKQAHRDIERGLKDTDRRGGDEYQQKTQNDSHADANSGGKEGGGHAKR
jgi:hypothetical protein